MRLRAQIALTTIGIVFLTVAVVLSVGYQRLRTSLVEVAETNVALSSTLVRRYIRTEAGVVQNAAEFLKRRIESSDSPLDSQLLGDFEPTLVALGQSFPQLTYVSISVEATGDYMHVERRGGQRILQTSLSSPNGGYKMREFDLTRDRKPLRTEDNWDYDPRKRPFYQQAASSKGPVWTPTYAFRTPSGQQVLGVTCAAPILSSQGEVLGVVTADIALASLSNFVRTLELGKGGQVFVVEVREGKNLRLIAHRDLERLKGTGDLELAGSVMAPVREGFEALRARLGGNGPLPSGVMDVELEGVRYFGGYVPVTPDGTPAWYVFAVMREEDLLVGLRKTSQILIGFSIASLVGSFLLSIWLARRLAHPLTLIAEETERLTRLEISERELPASRIKEINDLVESTAKMRTALGSLQRLVPADYARQLLRRGELAELGGERRRITILFCDIANFSTFSETHSAEETFRVLGQYLEVLSRAVKLHQGTIDKYTGDGLMAFWGAPEPVEEPELKSVRAALDGLAQVQRLQDQGLPFDVRLGIATGEVLVGNVGSPTRLNYTVLGDSVNLAARLEALNKEYGTRILIDQSTHDALGAEFRCRQIGSVRVKGREQIEEVFEVLGPEQESS